MFKILNGSDKNSVRDNNFIKTLSAFVLALAVNAAVLAQPPETIQKTKSTTVTPEQLSASFAEVARQVEPAVVNIDTKGKVPEVSLRGDSEGGAEEDSDDILEYFRRNLPRRPSYAVGSGFIVDKGGYILTNYHVIEDSAKITVRLQNGDEYVARIIGVDEETDLAVLKIDAGKDLPFLDFGNSENVSIGDWVLAVGSPFGLARTVTAGIISQTNRETPTQSPFQKFIQTDAAINRGNSGGPLVNMKGEVIGVNSQIATSTGDYNGIGFALPSNEAAYVYRQVLDNGKVRRGYLGVYLDSVGKEFAEVYGLKNSKGAIITSVRDQEGAAAKAGLLDNDIVIALNGREIENHQDFIAKVASIQPGEDVKLTFLREMGKNLVQQTVTVKLDERPGSEIVAIPDDSTRRKLPINGNAEKPLPFGLTLIELNAKNDETYRLKGERGLLIRKIDPASFIADVKTSTGGTALDANDLIQRINRQTVTDLESFNRIVGQLKTGDPVVLHIATYDRRTRRVVPRIVQFTVQ
jgi:serine protease Do